jgi:cytoskeletal protein CcmA (bactofilin family)
VAPGETVDGPLIAVDGRARVEGTVDGAAVVIRGNLVVRAGGEVDGDVMVLRGDARIDGTVDGNVLVLGGRAVLGAGAQVDGDVRSTDEPRVAGRARVRGDIDDIDIAGTLAAFGVGILFFWWFAVTICTALLGAVLLALVPRGFEAAAAVGRARRGWWIALLTGLGLVVGLPILAVIAVTTLIGLPLGLGIFGALGLLHAVGYVAGAFFLGRSILKAPRNRFGAFFVGWAILRVLALVPGFGVLVWVAAAVYGIGTLAVAGFLAGRTAPSASADPDPDPDASTPPPPPESPTVPDAPAEVTA